MPQSRSGSRGEEEKSLSLSKIEPWYVPGLPSKNVKIKICKRILLLDLYG